MIKELIKLATHLDERGLVKEADYLDAVVKKQAGVMDDRNYYMDRRTNASDAWKNYDKKTNTITLKYDDEDEEGYEMEKELILPAKLEVCDLCEGRGSVVDPSIDASGISQDDFDEDPDFEESYNSGSYNISCPQCRGKNVVPVVDYNALSPEKKKELDDYQAQEDMLAQDREDDRRTMMAEMGMGW